MSATGTFACLGTGRSVAWLARLFRVQEVVSSNLTAPTIFPITSMDPAIPELPEELKKLLVMHEMFTANLRVELLERSAGEVLYDDYLLRELRKGKPFKTALRKANAKFPAEALAPTDSDLADCEEHYRSILRMEQIDQYRIAFNECTKNIKKVDAQVSETIQSCAEGKDISGPSTSPETA